MGSSPTEGASAGGRVAVAATLVFLGVRGVVGQRPLDGLGDGRRRGQVGALRLEAVLVCDVLHRDGGAVVGGVREGALRLHGLLLTGRLHGALLVRPDLVTSFVAATIREDW